MLKSKPFAHPKKPVSKAVYVSIGNSDNKLTQREWANFIEDIDIVVARYTDSPHGRWFSAPDSAYQNFCVCLEIDPADVEDFKIDLGHLCRRYKQDSIAWAEAETEFIRP